ncbi:exported hypothetical protein [Agrobacterium deltaense Zutra 3/1]|uniref:Uncharacterized protein n=1 Tax=Agrobacterium deltaense Zutra 3/1 TaxID=1183427 RepID=A0A1S7NTA8_9HYPH|nr:exported hypothetical protein [Agrobacterium deltaense Zutra 3/1]
MFNWLNLNGKFRRRVALRHFAGEAYCLCLRALPCVVRAAPSAMAGARQADEVDSRIVR